MVRSWIITELVAKLSEAVSKECLLRGHKDLGILRERGKEALRIQGGVRCNGKIGAEHWLPAAPRNVARHEHGFPDGHACMGDKLLAALGNR